MKNPTIRDIIHDSIWFIGMNDLIKIFRTMVSSTFCTVEPVQKLELGMLECLLGLAPGLELG